jgi:hypothetical protein
MACAFFLGLWEFRSDFGRTYGDPWSCCSVAYDRGRDLAHRLTFRRFDLN